MLLTFLTPKQKIFRYFYRVKLLFDDFIWPSFPWCPGTNFVLTLYFYNHILVLYSEKGVKSL
ncbi:MAG: hypothetical protein BGO39_08185 [Chloroflexi bacterium 54-19]|nr:MAG: hypothetical protein BGO39_08185 [Chloroflexi bacterium 54-19]